MIKNNTTTLEQKKGVLALVVLAFGFAGIAIAVRYLSSFFTLYQQLYLSVGTAFILSVMFFPRTITFRRLVKVPLRDWQIMLGRVIVGYLVGGALYRSSLVLTKISNVTFIQAIPFAAVFGWLLFKEKPTLQKLALVAVAYLGVVIVSVKDFSLVSGFGLGELYSIISSAAFSISYLARKWQTNFLNDKEITQILLFLATLILFATSVVKGEGSPVIRSDAPLLLSVFLTGFFNVLNIYLINYGFSRVRAVVASNVLTLEAIFAVVLATIFYKEFPNLRELIGGLLIIVSVIQMNNLERKT